MKSFDKNYLSLQFKTKILLKSGTEFQTFFEEIMEKAFLDFQKIRPYGNMGDGGNDGYREKLGIYYQVYAPNDPKTKDAEAAKKFQDDFKKLKKNWDNISKIKEYNFVLNDKYGGSIQLLEEAKGKLQKDNPEIDFKLFLAKDLEVTFFRLDQEDILDLGFNMDQRLSVSNTKDYIKNIYIELDRENSIFAFKILKIIKDSIISLNNENLTLEYEILECRCLQKIERIDESVQKYENLTKRFPEDPRAFLYLAEIFLNDDVSKNKDFLEKAERIDPNFWLLKLEQLLRRNHLKEKIDIASIDEGKFPEDQIIKANFYRLYALIYEDSGDDIKADSFVEKAIHLNPNRFSNYLIKLTLIENRMFLIHDIAERVDKSKELLEEIKRVEDKFYEFGDIGSRNKALLNIKKLNALWPQEKLSEFEKIAQKTFNILMSCYFNKQAQQIIAHILKFVSLPNSDLLKLLEHVKISNKYLIDDLSKQIVCQLNIRNSLFTKGKEFFKETKNNKFYDFIDEIDNENDEKVLKFLKSDTRFAVAIANTLKSKPDLRKKIIHSLPDEPNIQKEKLLLLLNFDENDFDEAYEILKTLDLSTLGYFECQPIFQIVKQKKAWDFEIIIIEKLLEKESDPKQIITLKLELFHALLNLGKYQELIDIGEKLLKEYFVEGKLRRNDEYVLSNTILACFERGKVDHSAFERAMKILQKYQLNNPSFKFKVVIETEVYLHVNKEEKALESLIDGVKIKKVLSSTEYAKLYFLLCIRICGKIKLKLESLQAIATNSFIKLKGKDNWYCIGESDELDAILINSANNKYQVFLDKKVGEQIVLEDRYSLGDEERVEIIENIFSIELYILWKTIHNFNKLSKDGDLEGVWMVNMPKQDETIDPQYLLKFLDDLHSRTEPFFKLYCKENNIPLAMLAVSEGGFASAIGKIQRAQKGFINISSGTAEDFENQKKVAAKIIEEKVPFYIDATSALFLCEIGLLPKIISHFPGLKVPQAVINSLADISEKFRYTEGQMGSMGYDQGKISISSLEKDKSDLVRSNFLNGIEALESNPDNVCVISEVNKIDCFPEMKIPSELCDACSFAIGNDTPVLTDDPLYLKMVELQTKKVTPEYFSSLALVRVLSEKNMLSFSEYLKFFGYLSSYRCRFLSLTSNDIEKAVFGDNQVNVITVENILQFNFPLTLSEDYGVNFKMAFRVIFDFFIKVLSDDTITFDVKEKILFQIIDSFPTDLSKKDFLNLILSSCVKAVEHMERNIFLLISTQRMRREIDKLFQLKEIYDPEIKLWKSGWDG